MMDFLNCAVCYRPPNASIHDSENSDYDHDFKRMEVIDNSRSNGWVKAIPFIIILGIIIVGYLRNG